MQRARWLRWVCTCRESRSWAARDSCVQHAWSMRPALRRCRELGPFRRISRSSAVSPSSLSLGSAPLDRRSGQMRRLSHALARAFSHPKHVWHVSDQSNTFRACPDGKRRPRSFDPRECTKIHNASPKIGPNLLRAYSGASPHENALFGTWVRQIFGMSRLLSRDLLATLCVLSTFRYFSGCAGYKTSQGSEPTQRVVGRTRDFIHLRNSEVSLISGFERFP